MAGVWDVGGGGLTMAYITARARAENKRAGSSNYCRQKQESKNELVVLMLLGRRHFAVDSRCK